MIRHKPALALLFIFMVANATLADSAEYTLDWSALQVKKASESSKQEGYKIGWSQLQTAVEVPETRAEASLASSAPVSHPESPNDVVVVTPERANQPLVNNDPRLPRFQVAPGPRPGIARGHRRLPAEQPPACRRPAPPEPDGHIRVTASRYYNVYQEEYKAVESITISELTGWAREESDANIARHHSFETTFGNAKPGYYRVRVRWEDGSQRAWDYCLENAGDNLLVYFDEPF